MLELTGMSLRAWAKANPRDAFADITDTLVTSNDHRPELFSALIDATVHLPPAEARVSLDRALTRLGRYSRTREHLVASGALAMNFGERGTAYQQFINAKNAPGEWFSYHRGAENVRPWTRWPEWANPKARRRDMRGPITWLVPGKPGPLTVVCAGDGIYFARYARAILDGLAESMTPVHFHVVNWKRDCSDLLPKLRHSARVSVTTEEYRHKEDRTYFATVRFLRAYELMRILGPIYISDLDNTFVRKPENCKPLWKGDAGFKQNRWANWLPWTGPLAGYVYLNDTPGGLRVAQLMENYIDHNFEPNHERSWYFDQLLLNEIITHTDAKTVIIRPDTCPAVGRKN